MNIYEISQEYRQAFDALSEMDDLPEGCLENTLAPLKHDLETCALNVAAYVKNMRADLFSLIDAEGSISIKRKKLAKKLDQMTDYLKVTLEECQIKQIENGIHQIQIKSNPPSVAIENESLLPKDYLKEKTETYPDKQLIKKAIQEGVEVPGASLKTSTRLEIK